MSHVPKEERLKLEKKRVNKYTIGYDDLEPWRQDNDYLLTGYRKSPLGFNQTMFSLIGYLHNETVNIWSHLLPAFICFSTLVITYAAFFFFPGTIPNQLNSWLAAPFPSTLLPTVKFTDTAAFAMFYLCCTACLLCSATYHAFTAHSPELEAVLHRMDYIGIVLLITGTNVPLVSFGFASHPYIQTFYIGLATSLAAVTSYFVLAPTYATPEYRRVRTYLFIALGLSGVFPFIHAITLFGVESTREILSLELTVLGGVLYIAGALLYAERIPERLAPGTFDIFGASHQIFHIMVVAAAFTHYLALVQAFNFKHSKA